MTAEERFATFGPEVPSRDVPGLVRAGYTVMSFGYGDDDDFCAITLDDLWAWEGDEGDPESALAWERHAVPADPDVVDSWAPFAIWHTEEDIPRD